MSTLQSILKLPTGKLEAAESLEQLRWMENGYRLKMIVTDYETIAVDSPEDLSKLTNKI
jgi:3-deoxy-manno-octulosonate cytidylyltransferase (CMP-KDO synthetase)